MENEHQLPPPDHVLQAAREAEPQRILDDYTEAIHELRGKNFKFREIAEWLGKFGFEVDHNAVWRAYAKTVGDQQAHEAAEADDELERDEAIRDAELNAGVTVVGTSLQQPQLTKDSEKNAKAGKTEPKKPKRQGSRNK